MSWVPRLKKKNNNNKQTKICAGDQTLEAGAEGEKGEWASTRPVKIQHDTINRHD